MEAGHSTQHHSDLALLYPCSRSLQDYITEYFIVVVQICLHFQLYTQKSALGKFASSLNDAYLKEARSSLLAWSRSIQAQVGALVARRVETEAESNSRFRAVISASAKNAGHQQKRAAIQKLLDCCSTYDYETPWRQIRKAGNTSLYTHLPEYSQWVVAPESRTLILVGKLGYGKSVTLANIVDNLILQIDPKTSGLVHFFCRHDLPESLSARTALGALIRQIISLFSQSLDGSDDIEHYEFSRFYSLMRGIVPPKYVIYIVLDGLDLCPLPERKIIVEQLEHMKTHLNIRLCVSRRLEPEAELHPISAEFSQAMVVELPDNSSDIESYIETQLEKALSNHSLTLGDPMIVLEIRDALLRGSQGMFLWVALQIQSICIMQTDHEIRRALANLPKDLSEIYSRILQNARKSGPSLQSDIFKLVIVSRRPLTVNEMREALSVSPGDINWDPTKLLNNAYSALAMCGCLITIDEEEHTIRTIHPSINQFLLHDGLKPLTSPGELRFTLDDANSFISSIIVTYLSYGLFGTELAIHIPTLNMGSAPSHIINSTTGKVRTIQNIAVKLLRSRKQLDFDISKVFAQDQSVHRPLSTGDFYFQHYAKRYALKHLADFPVLSCNTSAAFFRLFKQGTLCVRTKAEAMGLLWLWLQPPGTIDVRDLFVHISEEAASSLSLEWQQCPGQLFSRAIRTGRLHAIRYLLELYPPVLKPFHNDETGPIMPALRDVSVLESMSLVDGSLRYPLRPYDERRRLFLGRAPLRLAIESSQTGSLEMLASSELIDRNDEERHMRSLLSVAIEKRNVNAVKILLSSKRVCPTEEEKYNARERLYREIRAKRGWSCKWDDIPVDSAMEIYNLL